MPLSVNLQEIYHHHRPWQSPISHRKGRPDRAGPAAVRSGSESDL